MFQRCQHRDLSSQRGLEGSTISTRFSISSSFLLLDLSLRSYPHLQKSLLQNMDQDPLHIAGGVQVPSMYRSSTDYRSTCSHFGCKIGVAVNSPYCCPAHMSQFPDDNTFALRYIGGFVDGTDLRRSCMVGIYNKCRGYQIGVPTLPRGTIFSSLPWNQPNIFRTDIVGDMAYLFFTDPPHVYPTILNTGLKWDLKNREEISFPGDQVVFATPLNLKNGGDITDPVVLHTYKLWSMYLFERGGYHLYCLVRSSVANQKKRKKLEPALLSIASNKKPSKVTSAAKPSKKSKKTSAAATSSAATSVQVVSSLDHFSSQCSQFSKVKEAGSFLASRLTCLGSEPISAYESSLFCETFHMDQSGWRECYLCSKRLHCGCIASKLMVEFMDYCGIGCTHCVNCNQLNLNKRGENPNLFSRLPMKTLGDRPHMNGKSEGGGRSSEADLFSQSLRCDTQPLVPGGGDKREDFMPHGPHRGFGHLLKSENSTTGYRLDAADMHHESSSPSSQQPSLNIALAVLPYSPSFANPVDGKKDMTGASQSHIVQCSASSILQKPSKPVLGTPAGSSKSAQARIGRPPVEGRGKGHLLPRYWPKYTDKEVQQISGNLNLNIIPLFEKTLSASDAGRIGRLVLPKACAEAYFPPISQSEGIPLKIQDVRGKEWTFQFRFWPNNNSRMYVLEGVTPCIQSMMLQAGDTVTFSRVDPGGKLIMGSRKAANAGDLQGCGVTNGTSNEDTSSSGVTETPSSVNASSGPSQIPEELKGLPEHLTSSPHDGSGLKKSESNGAMMGDDAPRVKERKRSRTIGTKNKRLLLHSEESMELRVTWEETQELLRPSPSAKPTIVLVEDHEFEEFDEPPVFGKRTIVTSRPSGEQERWASCDECSKWRRLPVDALLPLKWTCVDNVWDETRCSCSSPEESLKELENALRGGKEYKKRRSGGSQTAKTGEEPSGLDALASAAVLGDTLGEPEVATTTRHPRHRVGCSCIVCIQPPSGKGRHKPTCGCNVCSTVKRRFKTLMMRRKKKQLERDETAAAAAAAEQENKEGKQAESDKSKGEKEGSKGRIDLNSDPYNREDNEAVTVEKDESRRREEIGETSGVAQGGGDVVGVTELAGEAEKTSEEPRGSS